MRVAFQGEKGAYSEEAAIKYWDGEAQTLPRPYLQDVFRAVEEGEADLGIVPVENSIEGTVARTLDLLYERTLKIQGETVLKVRHCLIANPGVKLEDVKRVHSHPQALGQARAFLERRGYEPVNEYDTAGSVKLIKEKGLVDAAAIAGRGAAEIHGMEVLSEGIETHSMNLTRFLAIGAGEVGPTGRDKTSLAFTLGQAGALTEALNSFTGVQLLRIDTRPQPGEPWAYVYFVDLEGHIEEHSVMCAIEKLEEQVDHVKHLGSFPRAT